MTRYPPRRGRRAGRSRARLLRSAQLTVSSPHLLAPFAAANRGLPHAEQVKPFSFMSVGHVDPLAPLPAGIERRGLVPVAPFTKDAQTALSATWRNRRDGTVLAVTTATG